MDIVRSVGEQAIGVVIVLLNVYSFIIFLSVILKWFVPSDNTLSQFLTFITEPIIEPIRRLIKPLTSKSSIPLDFSPLVAMLAISFLASILESIF